MTAILTGTLVPAARWWQRSKLRLTKPLHICGHQVPVGFISDGASIPFPLSLVISPWGRYAAAAVLHDWLLAQQYPTAHNEFLRALRYLSIVRWLAYVMWAAVVVYGWRKKLKIKT